MKYIDEFRDKALINRLSTEIRKRIDKDRIYNIMDVCGTHTMNIFRFGLKGLLPENINLISGPGCPVCVTPNSFIDKAIALANLKDMAIITFGDMFRVPGSYSSLEKERAKGRSIRIVYSTLDALSMAKADPEKEIVFLGIGFETTAPIVSASILTAQKEKIRNYSVLCGHKVMPPVLALLASDEDINIDGFLLPGHVSAIIGLKPYQFLSKRYKKRCVIAGFEPFDIMQAILMLVTQRVPKVDIQYKRIMSRSGNTLAQKSIKEVFEESDSAWRGMGLIRKSGLNIKAKYSRFDAESRFHPEIKRPKENKGCICGDVLKGTKRPFECKLFKTICNPENPVGSCMVSSEGTCAAYYRYG